MAKLPRFLKIIILLLAALGIFLLLAPHYLSTSLIYWYANLDDYKIFENHTVNTGPVDEWETSADYNSYQMPEADRQYLEDHQTVAYLVIQNGKIMYEEYWDGFSDQSHSNIFSATKSVVSLLIGIAIDEGKIASVEDPIGRYLPEFSQDERGQITIKNLLEMSSGLDWNETYSNPLSITTKSYYGKHLREVSMNQKLIEKPGVRFRYQSGNTQLLAFIVEEATRQTVSEYAAQKLWIPMGAKEKALWSVDKQDGDEKSFCCFNTNARDVARFGQLVLNKGSWNGKQLVSEKYITTATQAASHLLDKHKKKALDHYGYQWWILPYKDMKIPYMRGHRGQYIYSIPEKNAVVVRLGRLKDKKRKGPITMDIPRYVDIAMKILK